MQQQFSSVVFSALLSGDVVKLWRCPRADLRPFLPYLVRVCSSPLHPSFSSSYSSHGATWGRQRLLLVSLLAEVEEVNGIRKYLELDFAELKRDAVKEQQLLRKLHPGESRPREGSVLASATTHGLVVEFERSGWMRRLRLLLSELLRILHQVQGTLCVCTHAPTNYCPN